MEYIINGEEVEVSVTGRDFMEEQPEEYGDWEVKLYFADYVAVTYIMATTPEKALDLMTDKLSHLLSVDQPEEVVMELKAVFA